MRCDECRFYDVDNDGFRGECRAHTPVIIESLFHIALNEAKQQEPDELLWVNVRHALIDASVHPTVLCDSWCGEFSAKPAKSIGNDEASRPAVVCEDAGNAILPPDGAAPA